MANLKDGLVALISGEGSISATKVYVNHAEQNAVSPYIVITGLGTDFHNTLDGNHDTRTVDVDFDCCSRRSVDASELADELRVFIDDFTGATGAAGVSIQAVTILGESDDYIEPSSAEESGIFVVTVNAAIAWAP